MKLVHGTWLFGVNATEDELETAEAAMQELQRIGAHSGDVVARWMHAYGLYGVRGDTEQCPVARWLRQATGDPLLRVGRYHVSGYRSTPERPAPVDVWRIDDPPATHTEFIGRFDDGVWPQLSIDP
jgi:class 3 adenylate cyclase